MQNIKDVLFYDPNTGSFTWLTRPHDACFNVRFAGREAGHANSSGYRLIPFGGKIHLAHRLAWFYCFGVWPSGIIDHIDRNRLNNAIANLRDVTPLQNSQNSSGRLGASGIRGIHRGPKGCFEVCVVRGNRRFRLGRYKDLGKAQGVLARASTDEGWLQQQPSGPLSKPIRTTAARDLNHADVLASVFYDPATGFFHPYKGGRVNFDRRLGFKCGNYRRIKILDRRYPEHVVALFYVTGVWPTLEIDHENGDPNDNRFQNLREVTRGQNAQNRASSRGSDIGVRATRNKIKRWEACVTVAGRQHHLGTFDSKQEAHSAWFAFRTEHGLFIPYHLGLSQSADALRS